MNALSLLENLKNKIPLICATTILASWTSIASSASIFFDDFEDGNADGWSITDGGGSTGVEFFSASNWAFVDNDTTGKHSLSREFEYHADVELSFDLQLSASAGAGNFGERFDAASGVTISFEDRFNLPMGDVSFLYASGSITSSLPSNSFSIGTTPESFAALMSEWASLAMVAAGTDPASIGVEFWAIGATRQLPRGAAATAHVRFDNVDVGASSATTVPLPGAAWLLGSAIVALGTAAFRHSTAKA